MSPVHKLSQMGSLTTNKIDYPSMLAGNPTFFPGEYESIATVTVSGSATTPITFSNIPQTYTHLQLRGHIRGTNANTNDWAFFQLNGQSTGTSHYVAGNGTNTDTFAYNSVAQPLTILAPTANATANVFGVFVMDILDYTNTNKSKTTRILNGWDGNGAGWVGIVSHLYNSTSAVTSITFNAWGLANFAVGSQIALYGIKGAA